MELKTVPNPIDAAGPVKQVISNLFYGWGFNFYRKENQLRADDLLIRGKVSELLGEARAHLASVEAAYRREHLPAPTRERPFPDRAAVAIAQFLERSQKAIEALETKIRTASAPEMDRIHQRHRNEKDTLERLVAADIAVVEAALAYRDGILKLSDGTNAAEQAAGLLRDGALESAWRRREETLSILSSTAE